MQKDPEQYELNESLDARVLAVDFNRHLIHLSEKDHIVNVATISEKKLNIRIGELFNNCVVRKTLFGGAFIVSGVKVSEKTGKKIRKTFFLHKV